MMALFVLLLAWATTNGPPHVVLASLGSHHDHCEHDFKVYVYPLSPDLSPVRLAEEARRNRTFHICQKCIYEQFALEYILVDFFSQFCGRTDNPEEADFFYLPVVRDVDYRVALQVGGTDLIGWTEMATSSPHVAHPPLHLHSRHRGSVGAGVAATRRPWRTC